MKFIGIDLAWTYKNETGLCVLGDTGQVEYLDALVYSDEAIAEKILSYGHDDLCIAVDAPPCYRQSDRGKGSRPPCDQGQISWTQAYAIYGKS